MPKAWARPHPVAWTLEVEPRESHWGLAHGLGGSSLISIRYIQTRQPYTGQDLYFPGFRFEFPRIRIEPY
jgi:hypothetical protein